MALENYMKEPDTQILNAKGDEIEKEEETDEAAQERKFKNYVYEMVFQDIEK